MNKLVAKIRLAPSLCALSLTLTVASSCGSNKSEDAPAASCPTTVTGNTGGSVTCLGSGTSASFSLATGSYVVAPFVLGDHASVVGAGEQSFEYSITAQNAALQKLHSPRESYLNQTMTNFDALDGDNLMRLVVNRFDIGLGTRQEAWIWSTLEKIDQSHRASEIQKARQTGISSSSAFKKHRTQNLTNHYKQLASLSPAKLTRLKTATMNLLGNCPSTAPTADGSSTYTLNSSYDGTDFCIGYETDPSGDSKTNIESAAKTVIATYKDSIYGDQMTSNTKDGYTFNPLIVFVSSLSFDGAFSKSATTVAKRPVLLIKSSLSKAKVYATIAHEMQHAIVDYYKARGTTTISETVGIDEGVAHLMEDAFGYGEDNFNSYVKNFLTSFPDGSPILANNDGANAAAARGGAYALIYFMAVRAGGFKVTSGKPFSGDGMTAITTMVKQTAKSGPEALASAFGKSSLVESVGQMIGALYSDNLSFSFTPDTFLSTTYSGITDLLGTSDLTFGLRYNKFYSFDSSVTTNSFEDAKEGFSAKYYESYPILITPTADTATVTVTLPGIANTGLSIIRIK